MSTSGLLFFFFIKVISLVNWILIFWSNFLGYNNATDRFSVICLVVILIDRNEWLPPVGGLFFLHFLFIVTIVIDGFNYFRHG